MEITKESLLNTLPEVLAEDERMQSLASGIAEILSRRPPEIENLSLYPRIRQLPENLLDSLAYDFKVDWWLDSMTLDEKRETLAQSWYVHKHMGTPASVKAALSAVYPDIIIEEWWEYGGEPYHFRLLIPSTENAVDPTKHDKLMSLVRFYKNLRSVLDEVEYMGSDGSVTVYAMTATIMSEVVTEGTAKR